MKRLLSVLVMLFTVASGCAKAPATSLPASPEDTIRSFFNAISSGDSDTCLKLLADDIVYQQEPVGLKTEGKNQLEGVIRQAITWNHKYSIVGSVKTEKDRVKFIIKETGDDYRIIGLDSVTVECDIKVVKGKIQLWTTTVNREDWDKMVHLTSGKIGIKFEMVEQGMKVKEVADNSPAYQAGIRTGDIIIAVDGINYMQMKEGEMQLRIQGPVGSKVKLTVTHECAPSPEEVEITRVSPEELRY